MIEFTRPIFSISFLQQPYLGEIGPELEPPISPLVVFGSLRKYFNAAARTRASLRIQFMVRNSTHKIVWST